MDMRSPGRFSEALAIKISRRTALQTMSFAGASAPLLGAIGSRSGTAAQSDGPPSDWFTTDAVCELNERGGVVGDDATCGRHGQLLVGDGPVYLSHLPMFMFDTPDSHPHHYQVVLEVALPEDALEAYRNDRQATEAPLYTVRPDVAFRMLDLIQPTLSATPVETFPATIVRGHWERQRERQPFGITWAEVVHEVPVTVERVVYAHEFAFHPQPLERLEYVLFGAGEQLFLAHRVTAAPDFDQLLPVTIARGAFTDEQLQSGIVLTVPDRANALAARLIEGDQVFGEARDAATGVAVTVRDPATRERGRGGSPARSRPGDILRGGRTALPIRSRGGF